MREAIPSAPRLNEIGKRDVIEIVAAIEQRGAPAAANKTLKSIKTFMSWCVSRAIIEKSPAEGIPLPGKEISRDRVLTDKELAEAGRPEDGRAWAHSPAGTAALVSTVDVACCR
jgi:site-specific recombinase XerC